MKDKEGKDEYFKALERLIDSQVAVNETIAKIKEVTDRENDRINRQKEKDKCMSALVGVVSILMFLAGILFWRLLI